VRAWDAGPRAHLLIPDSQRRNFALPGNRSASVSMQYQVISGVVLLYKAISCVRVADVLTSPATGPVYTSVPE